MMCQSFLFQGTHGSFTRPLGAGCGAKQELEQFRVNVNPSSHEQLKIILTAEEGDRGIGSIERIFLFYFLRSHSAASITSFPFTVQTERAAASPIVCAGVRSLKICSLVRSVGSLNNTPFFPSFQQRKHNSSPPVFGHKHVLILTLYDSRTS